MQDMIWGFCIASCIFIVIFNNNVLWVKEFCFQKYYVFIWKW
jgi:hypothetical protein